MQIIILGAAESGVGTAILAQKQGFEVFVSDAGAIKEQYKVELEENGIEYEENGHSEDRILAADEVMKSPGIPETAPLIQKLRAKGVAIVSEIEFAARYTNAKIIGITGSNGKTTTTNLTYHILKTAGFNVGIAGNVGYSFARKVATENYDWYVLEISSFQLDDCHAFRPDISILLNITPDHLDRYEYDINKYVASKFRIIQAQTAADHFIYNANDRLMKHWLKGKKEHIKPKRHTIFADSLRDDDSDVEIMGFEFETEDLTIRGSHNLFNACCAIAAAKLAGAKNGKIMQGITSFVNAPHRLEYIATINGADYINDSKATNVDSVYYALQAMKTPTIWIAGGTDKGNDYKPLDKLVAEKVKTLICMGIDNAKLIAHYSPIIKNIEEANSAEQAVDIAARYAEEGDTVLLSPACASFDLFKNYEDRGEKFRAAVQKNANFNL